MVFSSFRPGRVCLTDRRAGSRRPHADLHIRHLHRVTTHLAEDQGQLPRSLPDQSLDREDRPDEGEALTPFKPQTAGSAHNGRNMYDPEPDRPTAAPSVERKRPVEDPALRQDQWLAFETATPTTSYVGAIEFGAFSSSAVTGTRARPAAERPTLTHRRRAGRRGRGQCHSTRRSCQQPNRERLQRRPHHRRSLRARQAVHRRSPVRARGHRKA